MKHGLCALVFLSACGTFSNEDLLFLAAIPTAQEIELSVKKSAAEEPNALVGEPATYYHVAYGAAADANAGVARILSFVDELGRGHPATTRTENSRVWGPVRNLDGKGATLRLEIEREDVEAGARYSFCLHIVRDEAFSEELVTCEHGESATPAVLAGVFTPTGATASARSGTGQIRLDFEAAYAAGVGKQGDRGVLAIEYDFSNGGEAKRVHIDASRPTTFDRPASEVVYDFAKADDGRIDFHLEYEDNVLGGGFDDLAGEARETVTLDAFWYDEAPGRADVAVLEGDVPEGEHVEAVECWDAAQQRTYFAFDFSARPEWNQLEGDIATCPE